MKPDNSGHLKSRAFANGSVETEMRAFDSLGPLAKQALNDLPFCFSAVGLIQAVKRRFGHGAQSMKMPNVDQKAAALIGGECLQTLILEGVVPDGDYSRVLKQITPKSVRRGRRVWV